MRKGQVTIFIILGIMLIFLFAFAFHVFWSSTRSMPADQEMVYQYVTQCLNSVTQDGLWVLGKEGRLVHTHLYEPLRLEYYYSDGNSYVPSTSSLESELAEYVNTHLVLCTKNFEEFPALNFTYIGAPDTLVTLSREDVLVHLQWDLVFDKLGVRFDLDEFYTDEAIPVASYLTIAEHLVSYYTQFGAIDASYDVPLYVEVYKHNTTLILNLRDDTHKLAGYPYTFSFALGN